MSQDPQPGAPNAMRGIVIVVVAGILGLFLLSQGGTSSLLASSEPGPAAGAPTTTVADVPEITTAPTTAAPAEPATPAAEVPVGIFNATGGAVTGAAGDAQAKLTPLGYEQISLADASQPIEATAVYFESGFEANAAEIANALGYDPGVVTPAEGAENNPGAGSGASVVVVIGTDVATGDG